MPEGFRVVLCTPHGEVFSEWLRAARVPTETGQVGLRPGGEPIVLVVEPGLVLLRGAGALRFAATAGGLLEGGRQACTVYTPAAVVGASEEAVLAALERLLASPDRELAARRQLADLERRVVQELGQGRRTGWSRGAEHERPAG